MRTENDGVSRFKGDDRFVDGRRGGIGGGEDRGDDADADSDLDDFLFRDFTQDTDRSHSADCAGKQVSGEEVFGQLVCGISVTGLLDSEFSQPVGLHASRFCDPCVNPLPVHPPDPIAMRDCATW